MLVQLVMAAITTDPSPTLYWFPLSDTLTLDTFFVCFAAIEGSASRKACFAFFNATRSCGRRGPARLGSTDVRSSSRVSLKIGSVVVSVRNSP